jgi:hypothetical protein
MAARKLPPFGKWLLILLLALAPLLGNGSESTAGGRGSDGHVGHSHRSMTSEPNDLGEGSSMTARMRWTNWLPGGGRPWAELYVQLPCDPDSYLAKVMVKRTGNDSGHRLPTSDRGKPLC